MAKWLKSRLKDLGLTHEQFVERLAVHGIVRTRVTITNWVNGTPITLFMSPHETKCMAEALGWSVDELLSEAGYDIGEKSLSIPPELITHIKLYKKLRRPHSDRYLESVAFVGKVLKQIQDSNESDGRD